MFASGRGLSCTALLALIVLGSAALPRPQHASAQSAQPGIAFWDLGGSQVSGTEWDFSGDFAISAGAWESVTISNYGYCFVGPNDPRAGSAHAGAIYWFTELTPQQPQDSTFSYTGNLISARGPSTPGRVTITASQGPDAVTHVSIRISGSDLSYFQDNTLEVCLLGSS